MDIKESKLTKKQMLFYSIGWILAIIGILVTTVIYFKSKRERKPILYINPIRIKIVDVQRVAPSEIELYYKGNPISKVNVTAVLIYFWNSGSEPILAEDILEQIVLKFPETVNILEAHVLKQSRKIIKFKTDIIDDTKRNIIKIYFGILEKNDGAAMQIIYAGKTNAPITIKGIIKGCGTPIIYNSSLTKQWKKYPMVNKRENKIELIIYIILWILLFISIFIYILAKKTKSKLRHNKKELKNLPKLAIKLFNIREQVYKSFLEKPERFYIIFMVIAFAIPIIIFSIDLYYIYKLNIPTSIFVEY